MRIIHQSRHEMGSHTLYTSEVEASGLTLEQAQGYLQCIEASVKDDSDFTVEKSDGALTVTERRMFSMVYDTYSIED